jgi:hypothetical protein
VSHISSILLHSAERGPLDRETRYNPLCDADEESSSDMLSEEVDIDCDD